MIYSKTISELESLFKEKSKRYNYSYFDNNLLVAWLDARRKFDRIDKLITTNYCKGSLPDEVFQTIKEESLDLANYAVMFLVFIRFVENLIENSEG